MNGDYPLPTGWKKVFDTSSGRHYYACQETGETSWQPPIPFQTLPPLPPPPPPPPRSLPLHQVTAQQQQQNQFLCQNYHNAVDQKTQRQYTSHEQSAGIAYPPQAPVTYPPPSSVAYHPTVAAIHQPQAGQKHPYHQQQFTAVNLPDSYEMHSQQHQQSAHHYHQLNTANQRASQQQDEMIMTRSTVSHIPFQAPNVASQSVTGSDLLVPQARALIEQQELREGSRNDEMCLAELSAVSAGQLADLCWIQQQERVAEEHGNKQQSTNYYDPINPYLLNVSAKRDFMEPGRIETRLHALNERLKRIG